MFHANPTPSARTMIRCLAFSILATAALVGCNRAPTSTTAVTVSPSRTIAVVTEYPEFPAYPPVTAPLPPQARYDAALWSASALLNDGKLPEALAALRQVQSIESTPMLADAIATTEAQLDAVTLAEQVAADLRTVLNDGRPEQAAQLALDALRVFGDGAAAAPFALLRRAAAALSATPMEQPTQLARLQKEVQDAGAVNNLRGAALILERTATEGGNSAVKQAYDALRDHLVRYENALARAANDRRDPQRLNDAIESLREAIKVWDTREARRMIDECLLAVRSRRERIVIADFDVRGDVAAVAVSRAVAEEMSTALQSRFEIVEREEWVQACAVLNLTLDGLPGDSSGRREFARLTGARFLVLGSVAAVHGVTANATCIDLLSGLVVQTARVTGASAEAILRSAPQLAALVLVPDDQRLAYEALIVGLGALPPVASELPALPPVPEFVPANMPPPIVVGTLKAPESVALGMDAVRALAAGAATAKPIPKDHPVRSRAFAVAIELGDNLLRRGLYSEAHAQYQVACSLATNVLELGSRIDQCRPYLPPSTSDNHRPRVAVFDFGSIGDNSMAFVGPWMADNVAGYLGSSFRIVGRDELYWYLGRLSLTVHDVLADPGARFYLARALDARFVVLGAIRSQANGVDTVAVMLDTELGRRVGSAELQGIERSELRYRLGDLARGLAAGPSDPGQSAADEERVRTLVLDARKHAEKFDFVTAIDLLDQAVKLRPSSIQIQALIANYTRPARLQAMESARQAEAPQRKVFSDAERAKCSDLVRAVKAARAAAPAEAERQRWRNTATGQLIAQARAARTGDNLELAEDLLAAALALQPRSEIADDLAQVRAQAASQTRIRLLKEQGVIEAARRRQRESEWIAARTRLEKDRREHAPAEESRLQAQRDADRREYVRFVDEAKIAQAKGQWDQAWSALQTARRISPGEDIDHLILAARVAQSRAMSQPNDRAAGDAEVRLTGESAARTKLDAQIKRNHNFYSEAIKAADQALRFRQYDRAIKQYQEALKHVRSDDALNGMLRAHAEQARAKTVASAPAARREADRKAENETARLIVVGRAAFETGKLDEALLIFKQARDLSPTNAEALAWFARADKARLDQLSTERRPDAGAADAGTTKSRSEQESNAARDRDAKAKSVNEPKPNADPAARLRADFNRLVEQGKAALDARRFVDAKKALENALRLMPGDKDAERLLQQARDGAEPVVAYTRHLQAAAALEREEKFGEAAREYDAALKALPNDPAATKRAEYAQRMDAGTKFLKANKKTEAAKEFAAALQLVPDDVAANKWLQQSRKP